MRAPPRPVGFLQSIQPRDRDGIPNRFDRDSRYYDQRVAYRRGAWGDADRDGVPNRFDRAPANPYRR